MPTERVETRERTEHWTARKSERKDLVLLIAPETPCVASNPKTSDGLTLEGGTEEESREKTREW